MSKKPSKRFILLGGIPVFDYMLRVDLAEVVRATEGRAVMVGPRILLPAGTVFEFRADHDERPLWLNPLANRPLQDVHGKPFFSLEFGGKHAQQFEHTLCADPDTVLEELKAAFPDRIRSADDLAVVRVPGSVPVHLGGNNKNILEELHTLYASPELADQTRGIALEHRFFFDTNDPRYPMVRDLYERMGVSTGTLEELHVDGLLPRISYVLTLVEDDGAARDRIILTARSNEEVIPRERLNQTYFDIEYRLRRDPAFVETHLVINSMTNPEEVRLVARLLQTAFASGVRTYLCPTLTWLRCVDRMIEEKFYAAEKERFYEYRKDFLYSAVLPFVQYLVLNREELVEVDNLVHKKGIDATASHIAHRMNRGRFEESYEGGKVVVTGGSQGARYTERLPRERAARFWRKAELPEGIEIRFADRRIVCGDDYVTNLVSTLGAGDVFTGVFIGLTALGWDGGHALRAATLGAQHFIQHRAKPAIADMVAMDETHIRLGTETELQDVISHHVASTGDPTRYGTITDTVVTIQTRQLQHPFREILALETGLAAKARRGRTPKGAPKRRRTKADA
ncbi:MAG: hypothetical protein GXP50_10015 [Deltaproteobacteria bacterium]|nr:hypothetical protein [Deltaproteobacteria bacterium]